NPQGARIRFPGCAFGDPGLCSRTPSGFIGLVLSLPRRGCISKPRVSTRTRAPPWGTNDSAPWGTESQLAPPSVLQGARASPTTLGCVLEPLRGSSGWFCLYPEGVVSQSPGSPD